MTAAFFYAPGMQCCLCQNLWHLVQIQVTAAVANFLVNEARRNFHEPANLLQEQDLMIYNFCPAYTGKVSSLKL